MKKYNFMAALAGKLSVILGIDKGISHISIGYSFSVVFGGVLWFILAALMPANEYGILNYYTSLTIILGTIAIFGFDYTLTIFLAKGVTNMLPESVFLTTLAALIISVILAVSLGSLAIILLFLGPLFYTFSLAEVLGKRLYKEYMIILVAQRALSLILVPLLYTSNGLDGAIYGYSISYFPVCYRFFASLRAVTFSISTFRPIRNLFFHNYALTISKTAMVFSDKLIIAPLFGVVILGYYQLGFQMLMAIYIIPVILSHYLLPQLAANKLENIKKIERLGLVLTVLLTIPIIYFTPTIISYLFPKFVIAQTAAQVILLAAIPLAATAILSSKFLAAENSRDVLIGSGLFLGTQYALIPALGSWYGLVGLSLSLVLAASTQALFLLAMRNRVQIKSQK